MPNFDKGDRLTVQITKADIDAGDRSDPYKDPFSIVIKRALSTWGCWGAIAGWGYATAYLPNHVIIYWTLEPRPQIQSWMRLWDSGSEVPPIKFDLVYDTWEDRTPRPSKVTTKRRYAQDSKTIWEGRDK